MGHRRQSADLQIGFRTILRTHRSEIIIINTQHNNIRI